MGQSTGGNPAQFETAGHAGALAAPIMRRSRTAWLFVAPTPELGFAFAFGLLSLLISRIFGLPFSLPAGDALQFTGMPPIVPFGLIALWMIGGLLSRKRARVLYFMAAALSYAIILIGHFNIKTWMNIVNPVRWDELYWATDQAMRPIVELSFGVHAIVGRFIPIVDKLYLFAFLAMFACSIIIHSARDFVTFRKMLFTAMLVHIFGAFSYLMMPAIGPFIYEGGSNLLETARQEHMYAGYQGLMAGGRAWIAANGSEYLLAPVAAMPSLHVASSSVFVYYALRHERWLGYAYLPLFFFIMAEAVATRWHYIVDVFAGLGLTALAIYICTLVFRPIELHYRSYKL